MYINSNKIQIPRVRPSKLLAMILTSQKQLVGVINRALQV